MSFLEALDAAVAAFKDARSAKPDTRMKVYNVEEANVVSPMFWHISSLAKKTDEIPQRGTLAYSRWLDDLWKEEPILSGAVYSMVAKMQSLPWKVEGGKINAEKVSRVLSRARYMGGTDWTGFIGSSATDFYTQDNGVWWDVTREGNSQWGTVSDLAFIDTRCCMRTGSSAVPMYYASSLVSDDHWYKPGEYISFCSMPQPGEGELGLGVCACSRAARAAKLLMALHNYDAEKLSNLPPEGIATVTGLTEREFRQAIQMWMVERKKNNSLTFPQVLWLVGSNPGARVEVAIESFSAIPESFDRETVVDQYVNTLALCFGVDTREFWAISTAALGTASEAEVQHLKARGKGGGEFLTMVEQHLNREFPENTVFKFDTQDVEEDMVAATVAKEWIAAYARLVYPDNPVYKPIIDAQTFKRLLADRGVLPEWAVGDARVSISSAEVHKEELEDIVRFMWQAGRLTQHYLIDLSMVRQPVVKEVPQLEPPVTSIRGKPIEEDEVERGTRVTATAIRAEQNFWGNIPELKPYIHEEA